MVVRRAVVGEVMAVWSATLLVPDLSPHAATSLPREVFPVLTLR
jgi:hypothetical protein